MENVDEPKRDNYGGGGANYIYATLSALCDMEARFDNAVGGMPSQIVRIVLPWFALSCAVSVTLTLVLLNREQIDSKPHQLVTCAIFCISGSCMYLIYMIVNRMVQLVIASIESRSYRNVGTTPYSDSMDDLYESDDNSSSLLQAPNADEHRRYNNEVHNRIHREVPIQIHHTVLFHLFSFTYLGFHSHLLQDIISGMYMGGAGAFLSIPGLCMWDVPTTGAFLTALQVGGVWERIKVMEYKADVDQVTAIGILRALHWSQHLLMLVSIQSAIWISVTRVDHPPVDWPLVAMTSFAPAMLRGSCRHWPPETTKVSL